MNNYNYYKIIIFLFLFIMALEVIYTLIARGRKIILCDYSKYIGNFQQISLEILGKINRNAPGKILYNDYNIFFEEKNNIFYYIITKGEVSNSVAFSFISELETKFLEEYDEKVINQSYSFHLQPFSGKIKEIINLFSFDHIIARKKSKIDITKVEVISAENLFNQNEYIPIVAEINYSLTTNNNSMKYPRQSKKNLYIWLMVLFIIISFFVIILYSLLRK